MSVLVYDCGSVENTVTAILDTESGAMIIRGNGDIDNYADESSPWYSEHSDIIQVTIDKGITRMGSGTFYGCENLSFVEIANTVTSIGADVFQNCTSLTSIKIPKSITEIGNGAFTDSGLTEVKFYGNPPTVGTDIFDGVTADVYTPEGNEEWTETAKGTVAGNGSNLTWKTFDSKPNLIEYDELDYFWYKIKKWVNDNKSDSSLPIIDDKTFIKYLTSVISDSNHTNTSTTLYVSNPDYFSVNDCFYVKKDSTHFFYGIVSAVNNNTGALTYSIPASDGGTFFSPDDGQVVLNYGNPMNGGVYLDWANDRVDIYKNHTVSLERDYNIYDPILNINAWDSTTASIAEEDGVIDISGEDNHGQAFGGVTVVKDKVMGKCFYFDRSDSTDLGCLSFINHANLFYGMTKISLTFTFKATSLEPVATNTYAVPFLIHSNTGAENTLFGSFAIWPDGHFATRLSLHTTTNPPEFTGSIGTFETNKEYCLILTSDFTINKTVVYLNGVKIGECQSGIGTIENPITTFNFGSHFSSASYKNYRFKGLIKDFRIFDKVLTPEEVQVIYKQSLVTPYINSNMYEPILNLDADYSTTESIAEENGVIDVSGNQNNGQAYGGVAVVQDAEIGDCFMFKGAGEGVEKIKIAENFIDSDYLTLSIRIKNRGLASRQNLNVVWHGAGIELDYYDQNHATNPSKFFVGVYIGGTRYYLISQNTSILDGNWHTATMSFDGEKLKFYFDGVLNEEQSISGVRSNTYLPYIGASSNGANYDLNAYIADVKVYPRALTASEVYNVYQQSLNPEAFENPEKLISYDEINVHHFSGDAIQLDHLVRLGNLKGIADITDDRYGIFLGDERSYLKYDSVDGLKLINSNFALDGSILSDNFLWIDGNGNAHDDINMEIASDIEKGITSGQRYTEIGSMINMTTGAFVTPTFRTMSAIGNNPAETHITGNMYFDNDTSGVIEPTTDNIITFGSSSKRWKGIYSKEGNFSYGLRIEGDNASSYCNGIRIKPVNNWSGILFGGNDLTSDVGTSENSWFVGNNNGVFGFYKNGASTSASQYLQFTSNRRLLSNLMIQLGGIDKLHPKTIFQLDVSYQKSTSAAVGTKVYAVSNVLDAGYLEFAVEGAAMNLNSWTNSNTGQHFLATTSNRLACSTSVTIGNDFTFMCEIDTSNWTVNPSLIVALTNTSNDTNMFRVSVNTSRQVELRIGNSSGTVTNYTFTNCVCANNSSSRIGVSVNNTSATCMVNGVWETKTITARTSSTIVRFALGNYSGSYSAPSGHMAFPTLINKALSIQEMYNLLENFVLFNSNMATYSHSATSAAACTGNSATATTATNANNVKVNHSGAAWRAVLAVGDGFTSASNQAVYGINNGSVSYFVDANATSGNQRAIFKLGNAIANTSAAGHNGLIWMYGTSTGYTEIKPGYNSTSNITLTLPSSTGTIALTSSNITGSSASCTGNAATATLATGSTNIRVTDTDSNTWYPLVFSSGSTANTNYAARVDADSILVYPGTSPAANTQGNCYLQLGNAKAKATAGNKRGVLRIYGTGTSYTEITSAVASTARSISFPDKAGTVALTSDIPTSAGQLTYYTGYTVKPSTYVVEMCFASQFKIKLLFPYVNGGSSPSTITWKQPFTSYASKFTITFEGGGPRINYQTSKLAGGYFYGTSSIAHEYNFSNLGLTSLTEGSGTIYMGIIIGV